MEHNFRDPNIEKVTDAEFITALCDLLVEHKALRSGDARSLSKAFAAHGAIYFEDFLLEEDLVSKEDLLTALGEYYKLPAMDVVGIFFDHHLVKMFPKDVMLRNGFIPYDRDDDVLILVAARPTHPQLPEIIGKFVSYDVTFMVGLDVDICDMVKEFYDESIVQADLELFEDNRDPHGRPHADDLIDKLIDKEDRE